MAANCAIHQKLDDSHFSKYLLPGHGSLVFDLSPRVLVKIQKGEKRGGGEERKENREREREREGYDK